MSLFGAEAVLKLYALGWAAYFKVGTVTSSQSQCR